MQAFRPTSCRHIPRRWNLHNLYLVRRTYLRTAIGTDYVRRACFYHWRAYSAPGRVGNPLRGPEARPCGSVLDQDERTASAASCDHHGLGRLPRLPPGPSGGNSSDPPANSLVCLDNRWRGGPSAPSGKSIYRASVRATVSPRFT